jgi:hypothetical protein
MQHEDNKNTMWCAVMIGPELARNIALSGWWTLLGAAVLCFIYIQRYLQDPQRAKQNEEWFSQFEANQRHRYASEGINWRARDLCEHFASPLQSRKAGSTVPRSPIQFFPTA